MTLYERREAEDLLTDTITMNHSSKLLPLNLTEFPGNFWDPTEHFNELRSRLCSKLFTEPFHCNEVLGLH